MGVDYAQCAIREYAMIKKGNRGGTREGAGRKKMLNCDKKKRMTYALAPDVIDFLNNHRPAAQTLEMAVRELATSMDKRRMR